LLDAFVLTLLDVGLGRVIGFGFDWLMVAALLVLLYFAGLDALFGTTLGKRAMGLRVIGPGGGKPTLRQALIRESFTVLGAIPFAGPILALVAWIWILVTIRSSPTGRGRHDVLAGGTRVVLVRPRHARPTRAAGASSGRVFPETPL
jgi:uncharacterized RDD family membrane protein YckC